MASLACACVPLAAVQPEFEFAPRADAFDVHGRLSVRSGERALAAHFRWHHDPAGDRLDLATPVGQTIATLSGDTTGVRLDRGNGRVERAADWATITAQGLGWPLPVEGLASWIQGAPRPGAPYQFEPQSSLAAVLHQDGWTIVYQAGTIAESGMRRPSRLALNYPDVEVRIVIDGWDG